MNNSTPAKTAIKIMFFSLLLSMVLVCSLFIILRLTPDSLKTVRPEEVNERDLSMECVEISSQHMDQYPGELYTPEDFNKGTTVEASHNTNFDGPKYGTVRTVLTLEPGVTYGITGSTANYSQKLWINGQLVLSSGEVTDSANTFTPNMENYELYFTPTVSETEMVCQFAYFNHQYGKYAFALGEQKQIVELSRKRYLFDGLQIGIMLIMGLFHMVMYVCYRKNRSFLWISLLCLSMALHYLIYNNKNIMVVMPNLDWYIGHKMEYLSNIYYFVFTALFTYSLIKIKPPKLLSYIATGMIVGSTILFLIVPSTFYTKYILPWCASLLLLLVVMYGYLLGKGIKTKALYKVENMIAMLIFLSVIMAGILSAVSYRGLFIYLQPYVTVFSIFCSAIVLAMSFSRTERELELARQKEQKTILSYRMLEQMNAMNNEFLKKVAHELKTPLTVISGYAQLTDLQLAGDRINEETPHNLKTIQSEAQRLSDMVTKLMDYSYGRGLETELSKIDVRELFNGVRALCTPICRKNNNQLIIEESKAYFIHGSSELLLQIYINLIVNANKHTESGEIRIWANEEDGNTEELSFYIRDTGHGIPPQIRDTVFVKGVSGDGSSGLGLAICKEAVELQHGVIELRKSDEQGTEFCFTIPLEVENV